MKDKNTANTYFETAMTVYEMVMPGLLQSCGADNIDVQVRICSVLYSVLYCTALYCTALYCSVLYCIVLYCSVLYCIVLPCIALYCSVVY